MLAKTNLKVKVFLVPYSMQTICLGKFFFHKPYNKILLAIAEFFDKQYLARDFMISFIFDIPTNI